MKKDSSRVIYFLFAVLFIFFLACDFSFPTPNETALITAIGIEREEQSSTSEFCTTFVLATNQNGEPTHTVCKTYAPTVAGTIEKLSSEFGYTPKLAFTGLVAVEKQLATTDIFDAISFFMHTEMVHDSAKLLISEIPPSQLFQLSSPLDETGVDSLLKVLKQNETLPTSAKITNLKDFSENYYTEGKDSALVQITTVGINQRNTNGSGESSGDTSENSDSDSGDSGSDSSDDSGGSGGSDSSSDSGSGGSSDSGGSGGSGGSDSSDGSGSGGESVRFDLSNTCIFSGSTLAKTLNADETFALNVLTGNAVEASISIPDVEFTFGKSQIRLSVARCRCDVSKKIQDGRVALEIETDITVGLIGQSNTSKTLSETCGIATEKEVIAKAFENFLKENITAVCNASFARNADILGVGETLNRKQNREFKKLKAENPNYLENIDLNIKTNVTVLQNYRL